MSLLMVFALGACRSADGSLEERVAKLSAQVADLQKKNDELAAKFEKDQMAKGARLAAIDDKLDDIEERLK